MELNPAEQFRQANRKWPLKRIAACFLAVILIFLAGVEVGNGRLRAKTVDANGSTLGLPSQLDYNSVSDIYKLLKSNFDGNLDPSKLEDGLKSGLVSATGDPYTDYFSPKDAKAFNDELAGTFSGIGAQLGADSNNNIVIMSPLDGYPAQKAGLKPKDIIAAVNGQSTSGMSIDAVVGEIHGPANTVVSLTIIRGEGTPFTVKITRAQITVPSVESHVDGNIGYIKINQFGSDTVTTAQTAAQDFKTKGVKGVVLDLRGNPGGYLDGAVGISSLWLDKGKTVVSERKAGKTIDTNYATGNNPLIGIPTVVLIDGGSASASEITAGALHDNNAATLVGDKSFGKGSVQQVINLCPPHGIEDLKTNKNCDKGELKVTIAHWYTPNGKNINKQGITPDVQVGITDAQAKVGQDPQKDKAYQILQTKI